MVLKLIKMLLTQQQGWQNAGINLVFASQWQKLVYASLCRHKLA